MHFCRANRHDKLDTIKVRDSINQNERDYCENYQSEVKK